LRVERATISCYIASNPENGYSDPVEVNSGDGGFLTFTVTKPDYEQATTYDQTNWGQWNTGGEEVHFFVNVNQLHDQMQVVMS
jgi:hypothetical protein